MQRIKWMYAIAFIFLFFLFTLKLYAFEVSQTTGRNEIKWTKDTVTYYINTTDGHPGSLEAIQTSLQTWTDVSTSSFTFIDGGTTSSSDHGTTDGVNIIDFGPIEEIGVLGQNTFWFFSNGEMIDSDIRFNTNNEWSTDGSPDKFDVQNVGTHELGHSLSLEDLFGAEDTEKTMYGISSPGETNQRTLHQDDKDGISYLYPSDTCSFTISPSSRSHSAEEESDTISVTTDSDCSWTAESNEGWITITSGSSGTGDGTVEYTVSANTDTEEREGTIIIVEETFTITQEGKTVTTTTGTISGTITDATTGDQVEGATVMAIGLTGAPITATTDSDGAYTISDVPAGTYTIAVSADGYEDAFQPSITVTAGETTTVDISLTATGLPITPTPPLVSTPTPTPSATPGIGIIVGTITDADTGAPIEDAVVSILDGEFEATTDSKGLFIIYNITAGDSTLTITANGYETASVKVTVSEFPLVTEVTVELEPAVCPDPSGTTATRMDVDPGEDFKLAENETEEIYITVTTEEGCPVEDVKSKLKIKKGDVERISDKKRFTNSDGQASWTVEAKGDSGKAKIKIVVKGDRVDGKLKEKLKIFLTE